MPEQNYMSVISFPVNIDGTVTNVDFTIKDQEARDLISALGSAVLWIGATTTPIYEGDTTNPIMINGSPVTAVGGNMTAYNGQEFVWDTNNGIWQEFGNGNLGTLAYKDSANGSYTPEGTIAVTEATAPTKETVYSITDVGVLPYFTVSGNTATFVAGTLPTKGTAQSVVTDIGTHAASFTGTATTITVN